MAARNPAQGRKLRSSERETRSAESRDGQNFHRSADECIPCLLRVDESRLRQFRAVEEPACGDGALVLPLRARGFHVIASDIVDRGCPQSRMRDFLAPEMAGRDRTGVACVSNPPFNLADAFVIRACEQFDYVAMVMRLRYIAPQHIVDGLGNASRKGAAIWTRTRIPLARVILPASRWPMMHRDDFKGVKTDSGMTDMCWFVWDVEHRGPPVILREDFISGAQLVRRAKGDVA